MASRNRSRSKLGLSDEADISVNPKMSTAQVVLVDIMSDPTEKQRLSLESAEGQESGKSSEADVPTVSERSGEQKDLETPKIKLKKKSTTQGRKLDKKSEKLQIVGFNAKRAKKPVLVDENTTNSENSDGNNLLSDVDWEGNLDNDAQLDEFAPRRRMEESPSPTPQLANKISDLIMTSSSLNASRASFEAGEKVKVHNYNTSSW